MVERLKETERQCYLPQVIHMSMQVWVEQCCRTECVKTQALLPILSYRGGAWSELFPNFVSVLSWRKQSKMGPEGKTAVTNHGRPKVLLHSPPLSSSVDRPRVASS